MPQFDLLTLGAQVFGLLLSLSLFYYYTISVTIPYFIEIKKFRTKKLTKNSELVTNINKDLNYTLWLINYSYKNFLK
uniref:ATPase subunit 8 n=1 Tax=Eucampia zodiacus TaxID=444606 RepID=A0A7T0CS25_9STRA|nr:ATPase subunit 8 [Eucampia zodiacus]QPJ79934.1 ATPase subunit 8 [Eucampia zodiacus]